MPSKRLTEEGVKKLKAAPKQVPYFDQGLQGLVLTLNPGGSKTWSALYYVGGKPRYKKLGRYPVLSVKQAREKARAFLADPQSALREAAAGTFKEIAENFIRRHVAETRDRPELRSRHEIERCLNKYVYPHWKDRPFHDLRRDDVTDLLDKIEDKHGAPQADMVLAVLRKLMNWHQSRVGSYTSPIVRGMKRDQRTAAQRARNRTLNDEEIRAVWQACARLAPFGSIVKLALLTGQRREKIATMKWSDLVEGEWRIATEPREKGNGGVLRLPQTARDIISAQVCIDDNPYVFPGSKKGRRRTSENISAPPHFNAWSQRKAELDQLLPAEMPHWTVHDLRRTARSLLSRAGVRPDVSERVLGHAIRGVEGVYDRHSYYSEKADALERLAEQLGRIVNPPTGNVVEFTRAAAE